MYKTLLSKHKAGNGDKPEGHIDPVGRVDPVDPGPWGSAFKITRNYETGSFIRKRRTFRKLFLLTFRLQLQFTYVTFDTKPGREWRQT